MKKVGSFFAVPVVGALVAAGCSTPPLSSGLSQEPAQVIGSNRTEVVLSADDGIVSSVVQVDAPLPAETPEHPAACDTLSYMRIRHEAGPSDPSLSDAVLVAQPGILVGSASLEVTGRNTVAQAARADKHIEFWALDRRANCLEDHWGMQQAKAAADPQIAFDYYYRGSEVAGRTFAGFPNDRDLRWLDRVGYAQTVRDEITILTTELPESFRTTKLLCGGHSLGGALTGALAAWDFDGDPNTTGDAGYKQCAGFFTFDTRLLPGEQDPVIIAIASALRLGDRAVNDPTLTGGVPFPAEVLAVFPILALAAELDPDGTSTLLEQLPRTDAFDFVLGLQLAADWPQALSGAPDFRSMNVTNEAVLGLIFDDNSSPLSILRTGLGAPSDDHLRPKQFPLPFDTPFVFGVFGGSRHVATANYGGGPAATGWLDWQEIGRGFSPIAPDGLPYTTPANEPTDISAFSRVVAADTVDFFELHFPTRVLTDLIAFQLGDRSGTLAGATYNNGVGGKPVLNLDATRGVASIVARGDPVNIRTVELEGFSHLDMGIAAAVDALGRPAVIPTELAAFAISVAEGS